MPVPVRLPSGALAEAFGAQPPLFASSTLILIAGVAPLFSLRVARENRDRAETRDA